MSNGNTTTNSTPGGGDDPRNPFHYMPSMGGAVVSLVLYTLLFVTLTVWTIWKRSWYMITLLVGCIMEIIGYATRIPLVINPIGQIPLYACMHACLILAPGFYAALEYVLLGRLMHALNGNYSLIKPKLVSWIFIISDVISLLIQSTGAGLLTSAGANVDKATLGLNILLGGLAVNLGSFAIFCIQIFYFDYCTRKAPPPFLAGGVCQKGWRQLLYVLYFSSFLVLIRQIYRVIEFSQGFTGYLAIHEIYFYIFDTIPIFVAGAIFVIAFPGNGYLPRNRNETFANVETNEQHPITNNNYNNKIITPRKDVVLDRIV